MLQLQGEGIWCQDSEFYAEYYDSLDLSGSPLATQCEISAPDEHWHATSGGIPPALLGTTRTLEPMLFSARWTTRLDVFPVSDTFVFSSTANKGSRIIIDDVTILDYWEECCSTFSTNPVTLNIGYHKLVYEYRSAYISTDSPVNSFAQLSWTRSGGRSFGADLRVNRTNMTASTAMPLYADVGWLSTSAQPGQLLNRHFQAGTVLVDLNLVASVEFPSTFGAAPSMFGSIVSTADTHGHLRLLETSNRATTLAIEYSTCELVIAGIDHSVSWIAVAPDGPGASMRVSQRATLTTDVQALLEIDAALRLPDYFHWRNNSDCCRDRWSGVECRTDATDTPRVVVLDVHNVDLTNQEIPWSTISQLTALEELSLWNCGLIGAIVGSSLCALSQLQALVLNRNQFRGTLPDCMIGLPLESVFLNNNQLHGPLPELSTLGQYLKHLPTLNLQQNRWAPLLESEKRSLEKISAPLQVETQDHEHNWDFDYSYEWTFRTGNAEQRLMAEREESYRQWSAGIPFEAFYVELQFPFPVRGNSKSLLGIASDGLFAPFDRAKTAGYFAVGPEPLHSFAEARAYCQANHHDLASIHSAEDNAIVVELCREAGGCWIGTSNWQHTAIMQLYS